MTLISCEFIPSSVPYFQRLYQTTHQYQTRNMLPDPHPTTSLSSPRKKLSPCLFMSQHIKGYGRIPWHPMIIPKCILLYETSNINGIIINYTIIIPFIGIETTIQWSPLQFRFIPFYLYHPLVVFALAMEPTVFSIGVNHSAKRLLWNCQRLLEASHYIVLDPLLSKLLHINTIGCQ